MRLSDTLLLQHIDGPDRSLFVAIEQTHGNEIELTATDFARLLVGATYFIHTVPELRDEVTRALADLNGDPRDWAVETLIGLLGTLEPTR